MALVTTIFLLRGCTPSCEFDQRCVSDTVIESCSIGVDQCVGPQSTGQRTCESLNPHCVGTSEHTAMCVSSSTTTCTADTCAGTSLKRCMEGYFVTEDCTEGGNVCTKDDQGAFCVLSPTSRCDGEPDRCDGTKQLRCSDVGYWVVIVDCTDYEKTCGINNDGALICQ